MCCFDPSIHGTGPSMAGVVPNDVQPQSNSSIVPTVLGVISVAASVFSACIFCITGSLISLGCAVAAGLLAIFLLSRCRDNEGPQRQAAQVVHHVYQQNSPPAAGFVSPQPVWVETLQPNYRPPSPAREVVSVPVIPQFVSGASGEDHVQVRSHRPAISLHGARPRGEGHVQVRSHAPTVLQSGVTPPSVVAPATDWFASPVTDCFASPATGWFASPVTGWFASPAIGGLAANTHIGVGNGSTNGV